MAPVIHLQWQYLRHDKLPHIWCPGCGNGIVTAALIRAIQATQFEQKDVAVVSGIGCSSRAAGYMNFNTLHTTHGRALAFATGLKMARPGLQIFVIMGDGDCCAIGGNHFIHSARRNVDLNAIVINNYTYGMTGGQHSPLTPKGKRATTAPWGTLERPFDLLELARGAGATFGARGTAANPKQLERMITQGALHKGFSVIEVLSPCPVSFGRRNREGNAVEMLSTLKEKSVSTAQAARMEPGELAGKIVTGVFYVRDEPEYTAEYYRLINQSS